MSVGSIAHNAKAMRMAEERSLRIGSVMRLPLFQSVRNILKIIAKYF